MSRNSSKKESMPKEHSERAVFFEQALARRIGELAPKYLPEEILYAVFDANQEYISDASEVIGVLLEEDGTNDIKDLESGIASAQEKMKIETTREVLLIASQPELLDELRTEVKKVAAAYAGVLIETMTMETDDEVNPMPYHQTQIYEFYGG